MATIRFRLSSKADKATGKCEVLVRFYHSHLDLYAKTNVFVFPDTWNEKKQQVKPPRSGLLTDEAKKVRAELEEINFKLGAIKKHITETFIQDGAGKVTLSKTWLVDTVNAYNFPDQAEEDNGVLFNLQRYIDIYNDARPADGHGTRSREGHFEVLKRMFHRFLIVRGYDTGISLDDVTGDTLRDFARYLQEEHTFYRMDTDEEGKRKVEFTNPRFKRAFQEVPESRLPSARGTNSVNTILRRFRTFYHWAEEQGITQNYPFRKYKIPQAVYGTPYILTLDEVKRLLHLDLSGNPRLSVQRDIFVFQCMIGCRVSDLRNLTKDSVINGAVEYIPRKTKEGKPVTLQVPLNSISCSILERYKDMPGKKLLPCISDQKYNYAIKELFTVAGLTRIVTVMDASHNEQKRPLNEVASSHLARRTFISNLYKIYKDPNLIGKLTGHVEGSTAFARYRDIDFDIKKEMVSTLEFDL